MSTKPGELTLLLQSWRDGDKQAEAQLFELLLPELRKFAARFLRGERRGRTLQPTALNELYIRLARTKKLEFRSRAEFFKLAARS